MARPRNPIPSDITDAIAYRGGHWVLMLLAGDAGKARRTVYEFHKGKIRGSINVTCDEIRCVNPDHAEVVATSRLAIDPEPLDE